MRDMYKPEASGDMAVFGPSRLTRKETALRRKFAICLAIVAATLLVVACVGGQWLMKPFGSVDVGLLTYTTCSGGECETMSNFDAVGAAEVRFVQLSEENERLPPFGLHVLYGYPYAVFPLLGVITAFLLALAALGLAAAAMLVLARTNDTFRVSPVTVALLGLMLGIVSACAFIGTRPQVDYLLGVGWTFWPFAFGAIGGLVAVFLLNRELRPFVDMVSF